MENKRAQIDNAMHYIEAHLTEELKIQDIAKQCYLSRFYFQRVFHALFGMSVGTYIRSRRLSRAGEDLIHSDDNIIDIAAKYCYGSPDSFRRAFFQFHGAAPSAVRKGKAMARSFPPMKSATIKETQDMLEYQIIEKDEFKIIGISKVFRNENAYQQIPQFWDTVLAQYPLQGMYGICIDPEDKNAEFDYIIADEFSESGNIPEEYVVKTIPAATWAVFPCRGPLPDALQNINTKIWTHWLPACRDYKLATNITVEMYAPPADRPEDTYSEIWIPVVKV